MGERFFRWLPYKGHRHAIPVTLVADDAGLTLCGTDVIVPRVPAARFPDGCWPTCVACDHLWREHEGIPQFHGRHSPPDARARGRHQPAPRREAIPRHDRSGTPATRLPKQPTARVVPPESVCPPSHE
ncbi:zinc finger protein [Actinosynnema sp. NPDC020468]|uniref:zinc finger protein n=1 Tax=Actinosynnema sp. NPDC020468 TaxID=3154488 RepID=UPI0033EE3945